MLALDPDGRLADSSSATPLPKLICPNLVQLDYGLQIPRDSHDPKHKAPSSMTSWRSNVCRPDRDRDRASLPASAENIVGRLSHVAADQPPRPRMGRVTRRVRRRRARPCPTCPFLRESICRILPASCPRGQSRLRQIAL